MIQTLTPLPLAATLRDLVPWIPFLVILMVLSAYGIVYRPRGGGSWDDRDDYR